MLEICVQAICPEPYGIFSWNFKDGHTLLRSYVTHKKENSCYFSILSYLTFPGCQLARMRCICRYNNAFQADIKAIKYRNDNLTHICLVDSSILINWMSPFPILWMLVSFFIFIIFSIDIPVSKQWRPWSDAGFCGIWSGFALFAYVPKMGR